MSLTEAVFVVVAALILLALARWVLQWILGQTLRDMLTAHDNPAIGLVVAGYFFGVLWTIMALLGSPSQGLWRDIVGVLLYGCLGIVLLTAVALVSSGYCLGLQVRQQLAQIDPGWMRVGDGNTIAREFEFPSFGRNIAFVNAVAWIATVEGHHPEMLVGYRTCRVSWRTTAIDGLSDNDFICAAKVDRLVADL